jgi:hypothetical protein
VTHSWGTVILLDILFASRWDGEDVPPQTAQQVAGIRDLLFGMGAHKARGALLSSISTMGSPFSLFTLMDVSDPGLQIANPSSHDISETMAMLFAALYKERNEPLQWRNFIHPGDPIAYPLQPLVEGMLGNAMLNPAPPINITDTVDVVDAMTHLVGIADFAGHILSHNNVSVADAANAHASYWTNKQVADSIRSLIP